MTNKFLNYKIRSSYRQPPSLLRLLRNNNRVTIVGATKCCTSRYLCCPSLLGGKELVYKIRGEDKRFTLKSNMSCSSTDVIYVLQCRGCKELYVGQTGDSLRSRIRVHRQHIKDSRYRILQVSHHISSCADHMEPPFYVMPILKLPPNCDRFYREAKEKLCIKILQPSLNQDIS